jgi:ubiquinone/menaquinone biosynthesis C-methylase UbiE
MTQSHYTHGHHESVLRSHRSRTVVNSAAYLIPWLQPGIDVLDIGAGPGTITIDFAGRVFPGRVLGIDNSSEIVATATTDRAGVANLSYEVGDAYALDADDDTFDIVHAHQVLQHLAEPVKALSEWKRVCKPDGVVAARDADYAAMVWHPNEPLLDRWLALYRDVARSNKGEPDAGRRLLEWARSAGFSDVRASASVWCYSTLGERQWWGGLWADRLTQSAFGEQAVRDGHCTTDDLREMASAWHRWSTAPAGWFAVLHGEIVCSP